MPKRKIQAIRNFDVVKDQIINTSEFQVDDDTGHIMLSIDRTNFPDNNDLVLEATIEISYDDRATWQILAGFKTVGGVGKGGNTPTFIALDIKESDQPIYIRANAVIHQDIRLNIDFDIEPPKYRAPNTQKG